MSSGNVAPPKADHISAFACRVASSPEAYSDCSVVAAASPDGNFRRSWLIMFRFIGMASETPSSARRAVHAARIGHQMCVPSGLSLVTLSMSSAGMAETIVPPVE